MKSPNRQTVSRLTDLPNIAEKMAGTLRLVGIQNPKDLIGKDAYQLYDKLCRTTEKMHDLCVLDVFLSVVNFINGGEAKSWWEYTAERKKHLGTRQ